MSGGILGSEDLPWHGWMFIGLAIFIVCPEWCLNEIAEWTGQVSSWRHLIWLEAIIIGVIVATTFLLNRVDSSMGWFEPLIAIMLVALIRIFFWVTRQIFASVFEDDE